MTDGSKLIRNSTAEFLIFTAQAGEQSIEARYEDETVWLTQKLMAELFAVDVRTVSEHLKKLEEKYPALDRISVSLSVGVPKSEALEQVERFAKEVMPHFQSKSDKSGKSEAAAAAAGGAGGC